MIGTDEKIFSGSLQPSNPVISVLYMLINLFYHNTQAREGYPIVTDVTWVSTHEQGTPAAIQIYKQPTCMYRVQSSERAQECPLMRGEV